MANWKTMRSRITASVRTTNRMNALLTESMLGKRKTALKNLPVDVDVSVNGDCEKPRNEVKYFSNNFNMERVYKMIESTIEDRLTWDRFSRSYDPWRSMQLTQSLATEIRDMIKRLRHKSYRIICILSLIEKQNQGVHMRMSHLMDEKLDNFAKFIYERPSYFIVVTVYLVHKDY